VIFVTVGTQLAFDRLVCAVDGWSAVHPEENVVAQVNGGSYIPHHIRTIAGLPPAEFAQYFAEARVVVAHAGMGTIISALDVGKPLVLLPRMAALGEHRNDHQVGTARHFARFSCIRVASSEAEVGALIDDLLKTEADGAGTHAAPGVSPSLLDGIRSFLDTPRRRHPGNSS